MWDVLFLGVGEACDEDFPNTSALIRHPEAQAPLFLLLDCGFTVPPRLWKEVPDAAETLGALWLSHFHGDHTMGLPVLLLRLQEEGRQRPLTILGQAGVKRFCRSLMELAYPGFYEKLQYPVLYQELEPEAEGEWEGLALCAAETLHSQRNLALRVGNGTPSVYYSGDGTPGPLCAALAAGCDLVIHEAFQWEERHPGHGTARGAVTFARQCGAARLALVHMERNERSRVARGLADLRLEAGESLQVLLPAPGQSVRFS
ncbi:MAG: ribonuclease Z [Deltaproteobacteria bacterium]|nr:ribonuclease Z [Deltaproteobacteria bacterium]